jgi:proton glutamate symport protein
MWQGTAALPLPEFRKPNVTTLNRYLPAATLVSLVLGFGIGALIRPMGDATWVKPLVDVFDVIGTMWVNAIRMTVIPLIVPLLIGAIAGASSGKAAGQLGLRALIGFLTLITVLAASAAFIAPILMSGLHIDASVTAQLRASVADTVLPTGDASITTWFKSLIPTNPIKAAADGTMLSIIVFAAAFGFATLAAPDEPRSRVIAFCKTLSEIMMILVQGILILAPIGIFALTLVVGARIGGTAFAALGYLIGAQFVYHSIVGVGLLALAATWGRLGFATTIKGALPAIFVAAGTTSSLSALPAMIEGARDVWKLPERVYGFVLSFAVSTFKPSSAYGWMVSVCFIALLYSVPLGPAQLALAAGYCILLNATVPGIPGGGLLVISPMYIALGLPLEALAILLAVNPITDRFYTIANVIANMAMTAVLSRGVESNLQETGSFHAAIR